MFPFIVKWFFYEITTFTFQNISQPTIRKKYKIYCHAPCQSCTAYFMFCLIQSESTSGFSVDGGGGSVGGSGGGGSILIF